MAKHSVGTPLANIDMYNGKTHIAFAEVTFSNPNSTETKLSIKPDGGVQWIHDDRIVDGPIPVDGPNFELRHFYFTSIENALETALAWLDYRVSVIDQEISDIESSRARIKERMD